MEIDVIVKKLTHYSQLKRELEANKDNKIADIEQKVLEYRMSKLEEIEAECKKYKEDLTKEFNENYEKDLTKVDNYIDLLKELLNDNESIENNTNDEEEEVNEDDRDDNTVL